VPNTWPNWARLTEPDANIIKLPNISASVAQLKAASRNCRARATPSPTTRKPQTDEEKASARYGKCLGSAVNPVLREGNSDRRARWPSRTTPARTRTPWASGSSGRAPTCRTCTGDFYHGEKSMTLDKARDVKMELITKSGKTIVLKPKVALLEGEIIDSMFMSKKALCDFYEKEIEDCRESGILFSLHVKATMMKVSHPIVFGHCVKIFYKEAFEKHGKLFDELGVNVNNGINLYEKIETLPNPSATRSSATCTPARSTVRAGHGRFGQGHHQLPLAQRRDRRCLHAGHDPPAARCGAPTASSTTARP
jgi:isocitrate dehydrogenase